MHPEREKQRTLQALMLLRKIQELRSDILVAFPAPLPLSGGRTVCRITADQKQHINCSRGFVWWWHMTTMGDAPVTPLAAVYKYARIHGVAIAIDEDCSVTAYFNCCGLTFRRGNGQFALETAPAIAEDLDSTSHIGAIAPRLSNHST
jgi:hypothetical protein